VHRRDRDAVDQTMSSISHVVTHRVYHGRVVSLDIDTVQYPNGRIQEMEMVRHPGAVAILPFLSDPSGEDPTILLIRQYRHAAGGYIHEIPAGRLEVGEEPADCARRELLEETGFDCNRVEPLLTFFTTPGFTDERIHAFVAMDLRKRVASPDPDEVIEVEPRRLSAALGMIDRGEIQDAKTIAILLFAVRAHPEV
jgi:ADP-ribose pyrophosphatase